MSWSLSELGVNLGQLMTLIQDQPDGVSRHVVSLGVMYGEYLVFQNFDIDSVTSEIVPQKFNKLMKSNL